MSQNFKTVTKKYLILFFQIYRLDYINALYSNIKNTIGSINFELIKVENKGIMSLSQAYNYGAKRAKFNYLLFLHEDVKFLKKDWGELLLQQLEEIKMGIIGLAGGEKKYKLPTGHDVGIDLYRKVFVNHQEITYNHNSSSAGLFRVKTLDGVFLAMKKKLWEELKFNTDLKDFHFYDLDISLRSSVNYQNYVTSEISLFHFSTGNFGNEWICEALDFHKKKYCFDVAQKDEKVQIRKFWYKRLIHEKISFWNRVRYAWAMGIDKRSKKDAFKFILQNRSNG